MGDILDHVYCWIPLDGDTLYAPTGVQREDGALGPLDAYVVRQRSRSRYAIVWARGGLLHGRKGVAIACTRAEPMADPEAVRRVIQWGSRRDAVAELQA